MASRRIRQQWINGTEKPCQHEELDEIRAEGGRVIAERCAACQLLLAQYGPCAGCQKPRRLVHFVQARREAYCSGDCHRAVLKARREAEERAAQARAAELAGRPGGRAA